MNLAGRRFLEVGKLPQDLLGRLLQRYTGRDERLLVGPAIGVDAAVIDFGDRCLVATTDPITFVADRLLCGGHQRQRRGLHGRQTALVLGHRSPPGTGCR